MSNIVIVKKERTIRYHKRRIIDDVIHNRRVLITGAPGSGKSTILDYVAMDLVLRKHDIEDIFFVIMALPTHDLRDYAAKRMWYKLQEKNKLSYLFIDNDLEKIGLLSHAEACEIEASNEQDYYNKLSQHLREVRENNSPCFFREHIKKFIDWVCKRYKRGRGGIIYSTYQMSFIARTLVESLGGRPVLIVDEVDDFLKYLTTPISVDEIEYIKEYDPELYKRVKRYIDTYFFRYGDYYYVQLSYLDPDIMASATPPNYFFELLAKIDPVWRDYNGKTGKVDHIHLQLPGKKDDLYKDYMVFVNQIFRSGKNVLINEAIIELIKILGMFGLKVLVVTRTKEHRNELYQTLSETMKEKDLPIIITVNDSLSRGINLVRFWRVEDGWRGRDIDVVIAEYQQQGLEEDKMHNLIKSLHPHLLQLIVNNNILEDDDWVKKAVKYMTYAANLQAVFRGIRIYDPEVRVSPVPAHYHFYLDRRWLEVYRRIYRSYLRFHCRCPIIVNTIKEAVQVLVKQIVSDIEKYRGIMYRKHGIVPHVL